MSYRIAPFPLRRTLLLVVLVPGLLAGNFSSFPTAGKADAPVAAAADVSISNPIVDNFAQGFHPLIVSNEGPDDAQNVVFRFPIPEGSRFDRISVSTQLTCTIPPSFGPGDIACSIGDLPSNSSVQIIIRLIFTAQPGTKIPVQASVSSETPDPNTADNTYSVEETVAQIPSISSARVLKRPFRIEITGENLAIPQFGGSGIGIGCDCAPWPRELVRRVSPNTFVLDGSDLKDRFIPGIPTQICYFDPSRETMIKFVFTR